MQDACTDPCPMGATVLLAVSDELADVIAPVLAPALPTLVHACTARQARIAASYAGRFDAAIVQLYLPDGYGETLVSELRCDRSPCAALMVANSGDTVDELVTAPAVDFLFEPLCRDELREGLKHALAATSRLRERLDDRRLKWRNGRPRRRVYKHPRPPRPRPRDVAVPNDIDKAVKKFAKRIGLTPREATVMRHVALGVGYRDIATTLAIAPRTVKFHAENVRRKARVRSRAELMRQVYDYG